MIHYKKILLILIIFFSSCINNASLPKFNGTEVLYIDKENLILELKEKDKNVKSLKTLIRASTSNTLRKYSFRYSLIYKNGRLRIDMLPVNGAYILSTFIFDNEIAYFIDYSKKEVLISRNEQDLIENFIGLKLDLKDLMNLITSNINQDLLSDKELLTYSNFNELYLISNKINYLLNRESKDINSIFYLDDSKLRMKADIVEYASVDTKKLPKVINLYDIDNEIKVDLNLKIISINSYIAEKFFDIVIPDDFIRRIL